MSTLKQWEMIFEDQRRGERESGKLREELWVRLYGCYIERGMAIDKASELADIALAEHVKRFPTAAEIQALMTRESAPA